MNEKSAKKAGHMGWESLKDTVSRRTKQYACKSAKVEASQYVDLVSYTCTVCNNSIFSLDCAHYP